MRELDYLFLVLVVMAFILGAWAVLSTAPRTAPQSVMQLPEGVLLSGEIQRSSYFANGVYCFTAESYTREIQARFPGQSAEVLSRTDLDEDSYVEVRRIGESILHILIERILDTQYYCPLFDGNRYTNT